MSPVVDSSVVAGVTPVILDPVEVAVERTELPINSGSIRINTEGIDWGDAQIEAYMAEQARGSSAIDFRIPNREITIPLLIGADGPTGFLAAKASLAAKAALIQQKGGWLKRGEGFYADIVKASLKIPDRHGFMGVEADVVLTLEALPDFYGDEIDLGTTSAAGELVALLEGIEGDYPGRLRVVVSEQGAITRLGLIYALRTDHYASATTAEPAYAASELTPLDTAASATVGGKTVIRHQNLSTAWTPVLSTEIAAGDLTHTGTNRIWALVYSTSATSPRLRFVYDVGDLLLPEENDAVSVPGASNFHWVDLGEARLDPSPVGDHLWRGQIQAQGSAGGENVSIARLLVLNVDEGYGVLRASLNFEPGLSTYAARDEFNQTAGGLAGKTAPIGGVWAGAGDTDDFSVETTGKTAQRATVSDSPGRFNTLPVNLAAVAVQVDVLHTYTGTGDPQGGLLARFMDSSNFAYLEYSPIGKTLTAAKVVAGVQTALGPSRGVGFLTTWRTLRFQIDAAGRWWAWYFPQGGTPLLLSSGQDSALATGGALASGAVGIVDYNASANAVTRNYNNFLAYVPDTDAVLFANQSAEIRWDGVWRENSAGEASGPVIPLGDNPRLPPGGLEGRPTELFLLPSTGDLVQLPDDSDGDIDAQVFYRPSWLFPPG